jgi:nucleoside-diphosphate-sugar epimerase
MGDARDIDSIPMEAVECIIHLASVANDPCGDLDPELTWEISCLSTMQLIEKAVQHGVGQFIFASSGSVYGVKDEEQVTEDLSLVPISGYNKTKMVAERVLLSYSDKLALQIVRPATVCGLSPRMRLDVAVNMLTAQAYSAGVITVLGGAQTRPNIHIDDITDLYIFLMERPDVVGIYNAGFENLSISDIAGMVARATGARIEVKPSNDPRSYRVNSDKILAAGFQPKKSVQDAVDEVLYALKSAELLDEPRCYNLQWMVEHL